MDEKIISLLERMTIALEAQVNVPSRQVPDWDGTRTYVWQADKSRLKPVYHPSILPITLLKGIDQNADILRENTERFARGGIANNALLWGARGMGKSSVVKAVHAELCGMYPLYLIEVYREDIESIPLLLDLLRGKRDLRFIIFCDDLSFDTNDSAYKSFKTILEGGVEEKPDNVLFYATSNRRHLLPRDMMENESRNGIHAGEAIEEKVSLSDRFGLWLGFYACDQKTYLKIINGYAQHFSIALPKNELKERALEWAITRGARSGRVAWQFIQSVRD